MLWVLLTLTISAALGLNKSCECFVNNYANVLNQAKKWWGQLSIICRTSTSPTEHIVGQIMAFTSALIRNTHQVSFTNGGCQSARDVAFHVGAVDASSRKSTHLVAQWCKTQHFIALVCRGRAGRLCEKSL